VNLATPDVDFLRALVKDSRRRPLHVSWVDRDGTSRVTSLSADDDRKVGELALKLGVSKQSLLRLAAELPPLGKSVNPSA
jgi:hypothetical protein